MRCTHRTVTLITVITLLGTLAATAPARSRRAQTMIVLLDFGGSGGAPARRRLVAALRARYAVENAAALVAACDELGIALQRGPNLARCANQLGARAVIGGKLGAEGLGLAVYGGSKGEAIVSAIVPWSRRPRAGEVEQAVELIESAITQLPAAASARNQSARRPARTDEGDADASPDEALSGDAGDEELSFDGDDGPDAQLDGPDEGTVGGEEDTPTGLGPAPQAPAPPTSESDPHRLRLSSDARASAEVGIGTWMRNLSFSDPQQPTNTYQSGAAMALRLALEGRPAAFFLDGPLAQIYARVRYQTTIGLKSKSTGTGATLIDSGFNEVLLDLGYRWRIKPERARSPHVDFGLGYGLLDFTVSWPNAAQQALPNSGYRFVLLNCAGAYPFGDWIGGHARAEYRMVLDAGQISTDAWFGGGSVGGLVGALGLHGRFRHIVALLEYGYSRYFFAFDNPLQRKAAGKKAAGGALDQYHAFMLSVGYSL
ncbi:MAG: hypothetical protein IPL40_00810 [Proteobacteria bacterium]|nr:hypothetical protein [Pseudomonadota bacterium]